MTTLKIIVNKPPYLDPLHPCGQGRVAHLEEDDAEAVEVHLLVVGGHPANAQLRRNTHCRPDLSYVCFCVSDNILFSYTVQRPVKLKFWMDQLICCRHRHILCNTARLGNYETFCLTANKPL